MPMKDVSTCRRLHRKIVFWVAQAVVGAGEHAHTDGQSQNYADEKRGDAQQ